MILREKSYEAISSVTWLLFRKLSVLVHKLLVKKYLPKYIKIFMVLLNIFFLAIF